VGRLILKSAQAMTAAAAKSKGSTAAPSETSKIADGTTIQIAGLEETFRNKLLEASAIEQSLLQFYPSTPSERNTATPVTESLLHEVRSFDEDDSTALTIHDLLNRLDIRSLPASVRMRVQAHVVMEETADEADSEAVPSQPDGIAEAVIVNLARLDLPKVVGQK